MWFVYFKLLMWNSSSKWLLSISRILAPQVQASVLIGGNNNWSTNRIRLTLVSSHFCKVSNLLNYLKSKTCKFVISGAESSTHHVSETADLRSVWTHFKQFFRKHENSQLLAHGDWRPREALCFVISTFQKPVAAVWCKHDIIRLH